MSTQDVARDPSWYIDAIVRLSEENRNLRESLRALCADGTPDGGTMQVQQRVVATGVCMRRTHQQCEALGGTRADTLACKLGADLAARGMSSTPSGLETSPSEATFASVGRRIHDANCAPPPLAHETD